VRGEDIRCTHVIILIATYVLYKRRGTSLEAHATESSLCCQMSQLCKGTTVKNKPCRKCVKDSDYCHWHLPKQCNVCAEHPSASMRGRCGSSNSLRDCLRRPECPTINTKSEALLEQCGDNRPTRDSTVTLPNGDIFKAIEYLQNISTNWRVLVDMDVTTINTFLTPRQMGRLEAGPKWLRDDIKRWRTPPCSVCAAHQTTNVRGRCGGPRSLLGCLLRLETPTTQSPASSPGTPPPRSVDGQAP